MKKNILILSALLAFGYSCKKNTYENLPNGLYASIKTNKGEIIVHLNYEKAPVTVANFVTLAQGKNQHVSYPNFKGKPFFDGLKFHRVIPDFMIQTGDPSGMGTEGTGYMFKDEFSDLRFDKGGILAMANQGPATNSSQFFITSAETPWLERKHTIFGNVVGDGMAIVKKIVEDDYIENVSILRIGEASKKFDAMKVFNNYFIEKSSANSITPAEFQLLCNKKETYFKDLKLKSTKTPSGLQYIITEKGSGKKPSSGSPIKINYSGYLENGSLFDSSDEKNSKIYGKWDQARASQNAYKPIDFLAGKKEGLIPGFIEGIEKLNFGDKAVIFIPSNLGYGEIGAGNVIPPNTDLIFEIELIK